MNAQTAASTSAMQIAERPAMTVVGMLYHGRAGGPEIPQMWERFGPRMETIEQATNSMVCYGICRDLDMQSGEFDYLAAVEVEPGAPVPEGMVRWEVEGGLFASFPTTLAAIGDTYGRSEQLLAGAGYRRTCNPDYELYDEHFDPAQPDSVLYVCIPIEKA